MVDVKSGVYASHDSILDADPAAVIVTLFRDDRGTPRGHYHLPPSIAPDFTSTRIIGENDLLAPVAVVRALQAALDLGLEMSIVDPEDLWMFNPR